MNRQRQQSNAGATSRLALLVALGLMMTQVSAAYDTTCSNGEYLKDFRTCTTCSPGYYCKQGRKPNMEMCPPGTYSYWGSSTCTVCPAGYECTEGAGTVSPCATGYYSFAGSTSCTACENGYYCDNTGQLNACPAGKICTQSSSIRSLPRTCQAGYYCYEGIYEVACPTGTYSLYSTSGISICTPVPPGYGFVASNHPPVQCPRGYYQDQYGSNLDGATCTICPVGYACPGGSSGYVKRACERGTYNPIQGLDTCLSCPEGFYCDSASSWPTSCPVTQYSDAGQYRCTDIPAGMTAVGQKKSALARCEDGEYSLSGQSQCTQCPAGYKCPEKHHEPQQCESGYYAEPGAMICTICPSGHYCPQTTAQPSICPQGQWAPQGSYQCYECADGHVCNNAAGNDDSLTSVACQEYEVTTEHHESCQACPAGYDCPLQLMASIRKCGPGFYSTTTMDYCQVTSTGQYSPTTITTPTTVSTGYYAEIGMTYQMRVFPNRQLKTTDGRHTILCKPGYYLENYVCTASPAGTFSPIGYSSSGHRTAGIACPDGTWSVAGSIECRICPPGYDCSNKAVEPSTICADGYYQIGGNMACTICPDAHECNFGETLAPCPIWHYADSSTTGDCMPCLDGYDCTKGIKESCPAGTYSSAQDMTCLTCPPGYYCAAQVATPTVCAGGTYSLGGASSCSTCPTDYYSEEGNQYCTPVPQGFKINSGSNGLTVCAHKTYSDWGETTCSTCPDGYLCPEKTGFYTQELKCPQGSYCAAGVQTLCPAGTYGIKEAATSQTDGCATCPSGYNCIAGTVHFQLYPCPLGAYCKDGIYAECPAGTTGDALYGVSLNDCQTCPSGESCGTGATTSTTCGMAYYCPTGAAAPGLPCPAGTFGGYKSGKTDPSECLTCPPGNYCPEGSELPTVTPVGYFNPLQGIDSLDGVQLCPPGFYCPNTAMTNFLGFHCAEGHYCPAGTATQTQYPCPAGTFTDRVDVHDPLHCLPCPKGQKCAAGSSSSNGNMVVCATGEFCELGSSSASTDIQCPAGTYSQYTTAMSEQDCLPCTPGYFCIKAASSQRSTCPAGHYCPLGTRSGTQYPCPQGTYSTATGLADVNQCTACGVGKYCPSTAMSAPTTCAAGYYNDYNVNAYYCDMCPAGHTCAQTDAHPVPCEEGYYSDRGATTTCTRCPLGHYCAVKGTTKIQMLSQKCPQGTFCSATVNSVVGGLATYPNRNSQSTTGGNACRQYYYCPEGTATEIAISTLGYDTILIEGAGYSSDGIMTPAGYVSQDMTVCPAGYYCPAGTRSTTYAVPCPKGTYRDTTMGMDVSDCGLCPAGYYCGAVATSAPVICPTGKFCPEGVEVPSDCPLGTYNTQTGRKESRECTFCDAGYYCPILGMSAVDTTNNACDAGFVCYGGAYRPEPTDTTTGDICPAGAYCDATGLNYCTAGNIGIFQGAYSSSACAACEKGYYCFGGNTGAVTCPAGYFCPEGSALYDQTSQKPPAGYYNIAGQEAAISCALGTFTKVAGQSSCTNCEQGFWCRTIALADPDTNAICPAGFYCPSLDYITTTLSEPYHRKMCPAGTYQAGVSMTSDSDCLACPAGKACEIKGDGTAASSLQDCAAGFFCASGASTRYPKDLVTGQYGPCPVGHWCAAGTSTPTACAAGYFSNQERATSIDYCLICPPGFMCATAGLAEPTGPVSSGVRTADGILENVTCSSSNNEYCPLGSYTALQCYSGYYQDVAAQGKCKECPAGSYCINGTPQNCLQGYYCP